MVLQQLLLILDQIKSVYLKVTLIKIKLCSIDNIPNPYTQLQFLDIMQPNNKNKVQSHIQFDTVSPATRLLEKRRRMYEVHQAFEVQKQQYRKDQQKFKKVQEQIRKRDLEIQVQLVDFCQFLQQNEVKKKKAQERLKQEETAFKDKEVQIKTIEQQIQKQLNSQKVLEEKVVSLKKYEQFLEKVRTAYNDQFPQIADILSRHATLKKSNDDLIKQRKQMQITHEDLKIEASNYQKQMNQDILQLNNEIKQLSRRLEQKTTERNELQMDVEQSNEASSKKNLNLGKILMAIDNLYSKCSQGSQRIKHKYEQYLEPGPDSKVPKKKQEKKEKKDEKNTETEGINYDQKARIASHKLKCIFSYMKDFKTIIEQFKKERAIQAQTKK